MKDYCTGQMAVDNANNRAHRRLFGEFIAAKKKASNKEQALARTMADVKSLKEANLA